MGRAVRQLGHNSRERIADIEAVPKTVFLDFQGRKGYWLLLTPRPERDFFFRANKLRQILEPGRKETELQQRVALSYLRRDARQPGRSSAAYRERRWL